MFSVYNANTTTDAHFRFPLGAPILCGAETEIKDGCSTYRFSRGEMRECRIFVEQESGIISCREAPPGNARFRRVIRITGCKGATVRLFTEKGCECFASLYKGCDHDPLFTDKFKTVNDEVLGTYLEGTDINEDFFLLIGHKGT